MLGILQGRGLMSMKVEGDRALLRTFKDFPPKMQSSLVRKALRQGANMIRDRARALAPKGKASARGRGYLRLRSAIKTTNVRTGKRWRTRQIVSVRAKVKHAAIIEFGPSPSGYKNKSARYKAFRRAEFVGQVKREAQHYIERATKDLWRQAAQRVFSAWRSLIRSQVNA